MMRKMGSRITEMVRDANGMAGVVDVLGKSHPIPGDRLIHLQFRRYAGCPICNLHLQEFRKRHQEIEAAGIRTLAVFDSSPETLRPYAAGFPVAFVADPTRKLYKQFGVRISWRALFSIRTIVAALQGMRLGGMRGPEKARSSFGLPGDFLISTDGFLLAAHYGKHAYDQWSVDQLLDLVARTSRNAMDKEDPRPANPADVY